MITVYALLILVIPLLDANMKKSNVRMRMSVLLMIAIGKMVVLTPLYNAMLVMLVKLVVVTLMLVVRMTPFIVMIMICVLMIGAMIIMLALRIWY